jgi:hypothetical protein
MSDQVQHATTGAEYFSLADAGAYEETIIEGYRGDLDANAALPPLPHDVYSVRVRYADNWPQKEGQELEVLAADPARRWQKGLATDGKLFWKTWITVVTENNTDPAHDKRERNEVLTTYPMQNGTTGAQALLQGFGVDTLALNSHEAQMVALDAKLAGEGSFAGIEYDWEATVFDKNAVRRDKKGNVISDENGEPKLGVELWRLRGMSKFPKLEGGGFNHEIGPNDGFSYKDSSGAVVVVAEARARNFMRRWVPFGKLNRLVDTLQQSVDTAKAPAPGAAAPAPPAHHTGHAPPAAPSPAASAVPPRPAAPARPPVRRVTA